MKILILVFSLFLATPLFAAELTQKLTGKVMTIEVVPALTQGKKNREPGIMLTLQTSDKQWAVHLGPKWIEKNTSTGIQAGDEVMVIGATFRPGEVLARKLKKLR